MRAGNARHSAGLEKAVQYTEGERCCREEIYSQVGFSATMRKISARISWLTHFRLSWWSAPAASGRRAGLRALAERSGCYRCGL